VVVPEGQSCSLIGAQVTGNVTALQNSRLFAIGNTIGGSVTGLANSVLDTNRNTIGGNVKGFENSHVFVNFNTTGGNVEGDKAEVVSVFRGTVQGNITIKEGETDDPNLIDALVCGTEIPEGNVHIQKMTGDIVVGDMQGFCPSRVNAGNIKVEDNLITGILGLRIEDNQVAGDLQVFKNSGPRQKIVQRNTVGGNLQCFENVGPFVGGPNFAQKREGQCF
jgi:hypothetical protein